MSNQTPMLLVDDWCGGAMEIDLNESNTTKGLIKFRGKFQEHTRPNKNKRRYTFESLDENVKRLNDVIKSRGLVGELDHPTDSIIHFKEASHVITRLWWDGPVLMGEAEVMNTPHGKVLRALLEANVRVGISSRGVGSGQVDKDGILVIGENYRLITFDAVADPSTNEAYQKIVTKVQTENYLKNNEVFTPKNEVENIYNLNVETVLAAVNGIFKTQTNKHKERLR